LKVALCIRAKPVGQGLPKGYFNGCGDVPKAEQIPGLPMRERQSVRVLLISPAGRLLLIKYRNIGRTGTSRPCWTTCGGGRDPGETIEQTAIREVFEETGFSSVQLGPVVWYGEDEERSGDWNVRHREHFIVAFAPSEAVMSGGWTEHERSEILKTRWWTPADIRASGDNIYPRRLADLLEPVLAGTYPAEPIVLPPI
jgi:8-oxo-dGTP pyrophosphatase MutT (NUDIX family)